MLIVLKLLLKGIERNRTLYGPRLGIVTVTEGKERKKGLLSEKGEKEQSFNKLKDALVTEAGKEGEEYELLRRVQEEERTAKCIESGKP